MLQVQNKYDEELLRKGISDIDVCTLEWQAFKIISYVLKIEVGTKLIINVI
jgi:hypothetical protein